MKQFKIFLSFLLSLFLFIDFSFAKSILPAGPGTLRGSFTGIITEGKTNTPLEGVSVYFADIKAGTSTKADGSFTLTNIPEGRHLIEISHIGYTTIAEPVDITGDTKRDYILMETAVENDAVIITGTGAATQLRKSPFQVSLLRKEDLLQSSSTNIIEALAKQPGVSALSTGPAISKPVIRGLSYNRVLTINDGVRQEGQQWGDEHGIEIDQASVSKVEILKGPASLIYGSDATAGVINIITNVPVEKNIIKGNILSAYETNNRQRLLNANIAGNVNGVNWNLYGSTSAAADYKNKYDGYVLNSKFKQNNFGGYAGYNGNWGYSHLLFSNFNLKAGLVEGERDDQGHFIKPMADGNETAATDEDFKSTTPLIPYQHIRHFKIATDNSFKLGRNRLTLNIGYQRNQREEFGNPDDLNERELFFDLKTITYTAQFHLREMSGWKTSVGVNGMSQQNTNRGLEQLIPDYNLFDIGGYVYTQKTINKVTLSGGARYDTRNIDVKNLLDGSGIKGNAFTKAFSNFSGSIGLAAQLNKQVNVKLNVAKGFRAPGIPELASNGAHEGTIRYEYGDNDLKSETSIQLDAGVEFNTEHVSVNLSAFYNSFDNFIFYRKLQAVNGSDSLVNVDGDDLSAFKFQQSKAVLSGVEATVDIHPHPLDWLHFENTFSYTQGRFNEAVEGSKNLPFIPAARLISELRGNFNKLTKGIVNFYAKLELDNTFAQNKIFTAYNTETAAPGYSLLNAGIGADFISKGNTIFTLHLSGNNLADVGYQNHLSRLRYAAQNLSTGRMGVFNMGRNFSFKLTVPLTVKLKGK
ncbi:MAG: TonB-dependent receptor [Bacteroidota bacterium]